MTRTWCALVAAVLGFGLAAQLASAQTGRTDPTRGDPSMREAGPTPMKPVDRIRQPRQHPDPLLKQPKPIKAPPGAGAMITPRSGLKSNESTGTADRVSTGVPTVAPDGSTTSLPAHGTVRDGAAETTASAGARH